MNTIKIVVTVTTLTGLKKTGSNYHLVVTPLKTDGSPLANSNIPVSNDFSIPETGLSFILNIPITDGNYSIPNARFEVKIESDPILYPDKQYFYMYQNFPINNSSTLPPVGDSGNMTLYFSAN